MKKVLSILIVITFFSCDEFKPKETIFSNRGIKWYVEVIEEHEFLYRKSSGETLIYIHRPNCKACKLN
jgi:hypothetical protein